MASGRPSRRRARAAARAGVLCLLAAAAACVHLLGARAVDARARWPDTESYVILPPPAAARALSLGYRQLWADLTFARALVYRGDVRREVTEYRYLERFLDNAIALDPGFKRVYKWAPYAVMFKNDTVTADELRASLRYLERGMEAFPDDYEFFWVAGIRYFLDLKSDDPAQRRRWRERGAELIEQAMHKPNAPDDLATLAASMRSRLGQREQALRDLQEMILLSDNPVAQERMLARYRALAGAEFPDEARRAKRAFEAGWRRELPFAPPSLYVLLGDRPSPVIDFDALATERDLFGAEPPPGDGENVREADAGAGARHGEGVRGAGAGDGEDVREADAGAR